MNLAFLPTAGQREKSSDIACTPRRGCAGNYVKVQLKQQPDNMFSNWVQFQVCTGNYQPHLRRASGDVGTH